jgi:hypothetical protein
MDVNTIKEISKKQFNKLIENEVIGGSYAYGNIPEIGKHSSGFYDVKAYESLKNSDKMNKFSSTQTKQYESRIGVTFTKNKIFIEDKYVK